MRRCRRRGRWPKVAAVMIACNGVLGAAFWVNARRTHVVRFSEQGANALLATLLLAQGTPMVAAGSELGHTQRGNNNPYCQDNEITWLDWRQADPTLVVFVARLLRLRRERPPFADRWYEGVPDADGVTDVTWHDADGRTLDPAAWRSPDRTLAVLIGRPGRGVPPIDRTSLLLVNGDAASRGFHLPPGRWTALLDSGEADGEPRRSECEGVRVVEGDRIVMLERVP